MKKLWNSREVAYLRANYRRVPTLTLAATLGRSIGCVYQAAARFRCHRPRRWWTADDDRRLRIKHAKGWSDAEIAGATGWTREGIRNRRRALGLPSERLVVAGALGRGAVAPCGGEVKDDA